MEKGQILKGDKFQFSKNRYFCKEILESGDIVTVINSFWNYEKTSLIIEFVSLKTGILHTDYISLFVSSTQKLNREVLI